MESAATKTSCNFESTLGCSQSRGQRGGAAVPLQDFSFHFIVFCDALNALKRFLWILFAYLLVMQHLQVSALRAFYAFGEYPGRSAEKGSQVVSQVPSGCFDGGIQVPY